MNARLPVHLFAALALAGCALQPQAPVPRLADASPQAAAELAPSGTLRAAINFGNPVLASRDAATGEPRGVSVDLAREAARRLGVPVQLVLYDAAGKVVDGAKKGEWDIGFVAIDPVRAADMDYTAPYVVIEGAYAVPSDSPIRRNEEVDRDGNRVVVARGSAYDLFLSRELKHAKLVHVPTSAVVIDRMVSDKVEVGAGVKQQVEADVKRLPGVRMLDGRFMVINQAMATAKGRSAGLAWLRGFVEQMKARGFVGDALRRHGIDGAAVAPPGP